MVVHQGTAIFSGTGGLHADASIRVTKADQLPEALGQRTKPVIIENDRLERLFSVLLFWLKYGPLALLVAYLIAFGIERGFKIDASLIHDWKIERTEGKITPTPYSK
jgi:hypothetical protein